WMRRSRSCRLRGVRCKRWRARARDRRAPARLSRRLSGREALNRHSCESGNDDLIGALFPVDQLAREIGELESGALGRFALVGCRRVSAVDVLVIEEGLAEFFEALGHLAGVRGVDAIVLGGRL